MKATTLKAAQAEMAEVRKEKKADGLPTTGLRPLLSDYVERYLAFHTNATDSGQKPRTISREKDSLNQWIKAIGNVRLDKITSQMVTALTKARVEAGCKARTANLDVIVLRNVLKDALEAGLLRKLPTKGIKPRKVKTPIRRLLTPTEFAALCQAAETCGTNGAQLLDYLRLLAFSGARRNEALALRWDDVDFGRKLLCIGAAGESKNSEARYVNFNPDLEAHLRSMLERRAPDTQWVFPSPQRGKADKAAHTFKESFRLARTNAQLPWANFHDLPHYFISLAVMAGEHCHYVAAADFARAAYQGQFSDDESIRGDATKLLRRCRSSFILMFDDIGKAKFTERHAKEAFALLEHRTAHLLPTIFTTNYSGNAFKRLLSGETAEPLYRRIAEFVKAIKISKPPL